MSSKFITKIQQYADTEDYYIKIPDHILNTLKWKEGDEICWSISQGKIILTKVKDTTKSKEQHQQTYDWYTVKEEEINHYLNSESEGKEYKDFDQIYDSYIQATNQETYGDQSIELKKDRDVPSPRNFPHFP